MTFQTYLKIDKVKRDGSVTKGEWTPCNSFISNFITTLLCRLYATSGVSAPAYPSGSSTTNYGGFLVNAGAGVTTFGIVAGTGNTAVALNQHTLTTPIAHGSGVNQLSYGAVTISSVTVADNEAYFTMHRTLTNNSGGYITVKEVGLVVTNSNNTFHLIERTVLPSGGIVLDDTGAVTLTYKWKVVIASDDERA